MPKILEPRYAENFPGITLTPAEVQFARAMERYKRLRHRPFPTWHEVLNVLIGLGYRQIDQIVPSTHQPPFTSE
jgi:hypothetical protein